ncbi:MAG TPA: BON domain-containing protein [Chloroflexota bacterium]|nr:BON domain-containing protein [Chloroflexota bacterium]
MDDSIPENTSDDYQKRENLWDEQWPGPPNTDHPPEEPDNLDEELAFPESVGTSDVIESVRDQEPYSPPTDPPVLPGGPEGIHVATGFGRSAEEEQAGNPPPRGDEDLREEILLLLREDSDANTLPLDVDVQGGIVRLVGPVPSALDAERVTTLIGNVQGVVDVIDDTLIEPTA